eukprot:CAMPEP_0182474662 /NCGR_PEP_ID=MMETSP1319-20130603/26080_1 /TAXON_ID=172717 /ORGANISM="Bolidomonas pacifica, Strain RCC208" /LENGTH=218 /DNA_ID=CAMNT_0024675585 /DNA_START=298 /DNA_END=952 /DNA_ORIENTATION=+
MDAEPSAPSLARVPPLPLLSPPRLHPDGEGLHNVHASSGLPDSTAPRDAALSELGERQARDAASLLESSGSPPPDFVYTSPLRRAIQTSLLAFSPPPRLAGPSANPPSAPPFVCSPLLTEAALGPADCASAPAALASAYPSVDFTSYSADCHAALSSFPSPPPTLESTKPDLIKRGDEFLRHLSATHGGGGGAAAVVAVSSHSQWLQGFAAGCLGVEE